MVNLKNEQRILRYVEQEAKKSLFSLGIASVQRVSKAKRLADLTIKTKDGKTILIDVKSSGEPSYIYKAISQLKCCKSDKNEYLMVAVPKISEKSKEICKRSQVGYIDLAGQVFVKYENVLIDKSGREQIPKNLVSGKKRVKDLFSGNSLRVLIALLKNPFRYFTQEELSQSLGLSKAYINRILKTFEEGVKEDGEILLISGPDDKGIIKNLPGIQVIGRFEFFKSNKKIRKIKRYKIESPQKILDALCKRYSFNDNKVIGFYSFEKNNKKLMENISVNGRKNKLDYAFTLHAGASLVAPFVRFDNIYFYAKEGDEEKWARLLDLKRTEFGGNVFLVIPKNEWVLEDKSLIRNKSVVGNILLYLDLVNYPKRGKEQADFLRKKKMQY